MTNAELLAKIKAEIRRRIRENESWKDFHRSKGETTNFDDVKIVELQSILSFISTLESEKPRQEGLEKEIKRYLQEEHDRDTTVGDVARHFAQWGAEHLADARKTLEIKPGDEVTINGHKIVYDKDKGYVTIVKSEESVPKDLEEAAHSYSESDEPLYSPGHRFHWDSDSLFGKQIETTFIAGAKWNKEQMMSKAVEGTIDDCGTPARLRLEMPGGSFRIGDKVRVIVLPKEETK